MNSITIVGRAGKNPEVKYFESGTVVANLTAEQAARRRYWREQAAAATLAGSIWPEAQRLGGGA